MNDQLNRAKEEIKEIPYPNYLKIESPYKQEVKRVKVDRWISRDYHYREVEKIWKKCWQVACREEDIPQVGDYIVYDIAHLSFIVMRSAENEFRAYWNSCPHRARKLKEFDGHGVSELRCMYHGWAWNIDGTVKQISCEWDFPGVEDEAALVQARTGTWGGFVFINPDPDCESLEDFLGTLPDHFEKAGHDFATRWKQAHVAVVIEANWKVVQEAFIEPWHVISTHPQLVAEQSHLNASDGRWDDFGNWMRAAPNLPTDKQEAKPAWSVKTNDNQHVIDSNFDRHLNEPPIIAAHAGESPSQQILGETRNYLRGIMGDKVDAYHDVELYGGQMVHVFPNFHPWGAFSRITYRFRPYGNDPDKSIMEVMLMAPWPDGRPKPPPAKIHWLKPGEDTSAAPELGQLARIFIQDCGNMPFVQLGLKTNGRGYVIMSEHNETPVRHLHDLYEKWMELAEGE